MNAWRVRGKGEGREGEGRREGGVLQPGQEIGDYNAALSSDLGGGGFGGGGGGGFGKRWAARRRRKGR